MNMRQESTDVGFLGPEVYPINDSLRKKKLPSKIPWWICFRKEKISITIQYTFFKS